MRTLHVRMFALVASAALVAGCGGSGGDSSGTDDTIDAVTTTTTTTTSTVVTTTTVGGMTTEPRVDSTTVPPGAGIGSYTEVQPAIVQIVAQGSFRDPEVGMVSGAGRGSGFIISEDGLAVTNNHVVTGAATLEVFIGGDDTRGYNATVVGVSECNDLALIRIMSDEPLPYLAWVDESPSVGTEIFVAGFPLGDPEYTLTRGIVSKAQAAGDTPWASIDSIIEHDANTQPGNSGGPLVGVDGRVVGVHYAGGSPTNTAQFFAIEGVLAQRVVDHLRDGDFESLGINGTAVVDDASGIAGIWVAGTAPGSPGSNAGILPGDIVTSLNGLPIATDGTMKDYCDVIRTAGERPISVEVLRFDSQEVLQGEINGELPLEQVFSFAEEIDDDVDVPAAPGGAYVEYVTIFDDTGSMMVDVPAVWSDTDTVPFDDGTPWISASTSLDDLYGTYSVPGIIMVAYPTIPPDQMAATIDEWITPGACLTDDGLADYDDGFFAGQFRLLADCGDTGAVQVFIAANSYSGAGGVLIVMQIVSDADFEALDTVIATFDLV